MDYDVLVVGSGIGGMESALKLGDMGYRVLVVEKAPSVGGRMVLLSKVFPTLDCASCIATPKMAATAHHRNVTVLTDSDVRAVDARRRRRLPRGRPAQVPVRGSRRLHRVPAVRGRVHRGGPRRVERRDGRSPGRVRGLPAGHPAEGAHRSPRHLAVHRRMPGRDQGTWLRVPGSVGALRRGLPVDPRRHAPGRVLGCRLLRAM